MASALAVHRPTWRSVDRYIALTAGIAAHLADYGIPDDRITIKPNGVPDPFSPEVPGREGEPGSGFVFVGRLSPEKGLGLLLDAWQRHPDQSLGALRIAGDGELRPLAVAAAAQRVDVEYLGTLDSAGVRAAIQSAAVLVAPPTWHDVLPTVVIEALANARPVLGTALGGIPYLIGAAEQASAGGVAGWLVEPDPAALAAALPIALAGAPALAACARARYESTFHPDLLTKQLIEIYEALRR
jgi:glycosyltransferase involved in cell wall biosynthesis